MWFVCCSSRCSLRSHLKVDLCVLELNQWFRRGRIENYMNILTKDGTLAVAAGNEVRALMVLVRAIRMAAGVLTFLAYQ